MSADITVPPPSNADISTKKCSSQTNLEENHSNNSSTTTATITTTTNSNCNNNVSDTITVSSTTTGKVGPQNKSATLTLGQHNSNGSSYHSRNNLRRSFTLPRGLFLRKSGQTGPASENKNGSFLRNIFLTLGRTRSKRHKKNHDSSTPVTNGNDTLPNSGFPPGFIPGALGLKNLGNTCFINAIVQCLSHTDALAKYLVTDAYRVDLRRKNNWIKSGKGEVTEELAAILRSTWLRQNASVVEEAVSRFKSAVERGAQQWRGSEQHDAQEFLLWILDRLHEADDSESVEEHSSVAQTRLKHSEETVSTVTLEECFDLYTTAEQLSAEDSWHCPHCNRKEQGTLKMIGLWTAPDVLVVHLKRFRQALKWRVSATKISAVVDFPVEGLDLEPHVQGPHVTKRSKVGVDGHIANGGPLSQASHSIYPNGCFGLGSWKRASFKKNLTAVSNVNRVNTANGNNVNHMADDNNRENLIYDLFAVCNHHGDIKSGHYTAYCKNPVEGSWWSFDDTRVTQLSPDEVKNASAYILFYHKRSSATPQLASQYNGYHWCRTLLKKYHKLPPPSIISTNGHSVVDPTNTSVNNQSNGTSSDEETKDVVTNQTNNGKQEASTELTDNKQKIDDFYRQFTKFPDQKNNQSGCGDSVNKNVSTLPPSKQQPQINGYHNESTSNTFVSNTNSLGKSSSSSSGNSAPLARMEEIAIGIGMAMPKEVQIESTV